MCNFLAIFINVCKRLFFLNGLLKYVSFSLSSV